MLISISLLILCVDTFSPVLQKASTVDKKNEENTPVFIQELLQKITIFKVGVISQFVKNKLLSLLNKKVESSKKKLGLAEGDSEFLNNIMGTTMMMVSIGRGDYFATKGELTVSSLIAVDQLDDYIVLEYYRNGGHFHIFSLKCNSCPSFLSIDAILTLKSASKPFAYSIKNSFFKNGCFSVL